MDPADLIADDLDESGSGGDMPDVSPVRPTRGGYRPGAGRKPKGEQGDAYTLLAKAKAKREAFLAQMAERDYKKSMNDLIPADVVASHWVEQVQITKSRLLSLPARLAPDMIACPDIRAAENLIRDAIYEVLAELANERTSEDRNPIGG